MTFFENRSGAGRVEKLLRSALEERQALLLSVVNWGEIYYSIWRVRGRLAAEQKIMELAQLPIEVIDVDLQTTRLASALKAEHALPYTDCFAAALAHQAKASLVTSDQDFKRIQRRIRIYWV